MGSLTTWRGHKYDPHTYPMTNGARINANAVFRDACCCASLAGDPANAPHQDYWLKEASACTLDEPGNTF